MTYPRWLLTLPLLALPAMACSPSGEARLASSSAGGASGTGPAAGTGGEAAETGGTGSAGETSGAGGAGGGTSGPGGAISCQGSGPTGYNPYKHSYYGELHLHTSYSLDAYTFGTRTDPDSAYLFAKGQARIHVGEGSDAPPGPKITQARPIDFLAVTDHSEWLFVTQGCTVDRQSGYYDTGDCGLVRSRNVTDETTAFDTTRRFKGPLCNGDQSACKKQQKTAWHAVIDAANKAYVPCEFTSLIGYEWSDSEDVIDPTTSQSASAMNHRNVIFASDKVPAVPLDSVGYPTPPQLWTGLDRECKAASGCDVVTLPHNTNLSGGISLVVWDPTPAGVAQQQRYQVSAEVYQHKGASECYYDPSSGYSDADCQFEYPSASTVNLGPASFIREGLGTGVGYAAANTAQGNPLKLGIVGGTDDHNGAPANVDEEKYVGHAGVRDDTALKRLTGSPQNGSGAITGVWAEENTRESIFAAIKRRETFATSGPRLSVRFYQTSDATACADPAFPKKIIDAGTALPMGSTFGATALAGGSAPTFAIAVWPDAVPQKLADDTTAVAGLAKVQIIKVHAHVESGQPVIVEDTPYVVSGIPATGGCATWTDPSFDPSEYVLYYVRALQVPTWRWSHWSCKEVREEYPATWQAMVPGCEPGGGLDVSIQERVWSSPVWYEPG